VPLTAAAAAVALWVAVPDRNALVSPPTDQFLIQDKIAPSKATKPAPPSADGRQTFSATQAPQAFAAPEARTRTDSPQQPPVDSGTATKTKEVASNDAAKDEVARNGVAGRLEETENLKKAATTAAAPAAQAAAAPPSPPSPPPERIGVLARSAARAADVAATEIVSPDPNVRWRIVGSAVQHSSNGGSTWEAASTGMAAELTAGAAPSASVCWLVGRAGVVLRTTDGRTWRRVPFPEMTDLSAVRAIDADGNVASVSTADGRTFSTTDGGATWVSR
jgi:hypothetical protein